ncbi:MAG: preprotein translocase subunit SecG [Parcubacteria group bacterium Gr01-1014_38]|nr:MAG: preprotein translocase subunit SecG [Parcubacteria group bacterium Gr01-1014_38]
MPSTLLTGAQIAISVLLIVAVLLQNRGAGLGATFGGDSAIYHTKRGLEKRLHQITILLAALFLTISLLHLIL